MKRRSRAARRAGVLLSSAAVLAGLAAVTTPTAEAAITPLITGRAVNQVGEANGTTVLSVVAWPDDSVLNALADDADVPTQVLQTTRPDSSGNYTIDPDLSGLSADYVESDGTVNLEVDAYDDDNLGAESYNFTAALPGSEAATENPLVAVSGVRSQTASFDLAASNETTALGTDPATTAVTINSANATMGMNQPGGGGMTPAVPGGRQSCAKWKSVQYYPARAEKFMNVYTAGSVTVEETASSSHSLGIGVAVTGSGWSASGSKTVTVSTDSANTKSYSRNEQLQNDVNYRHYTQKCVNKPAPSGKGTFYRHRVQATSMNYALVRATGIKDTTWNYKSTGYCSYQTSGKPSKSKGSNQSFDGGVSAPFLNLDVHASYSKHTKVTWSVPSSGAYLCGSSSAGFSSAPFSGEDKDPSGNGTCTRCAIVGLNGNDAEADTA